MIIMFFFQYVDGVFATQDVICQPQVRKGVIKLQ